MTGSITEVYHVQCMCMHDTRKKSFDRDGKSFNFLEVR